MILRRFVLVHAQAREGAARYMREAPDGVEVVIKEPTRTSDQNAKFHAMCSGLAKSGLEWAGKKRTAQQWKNLIVSGFCVATNERAEIVPGIEGEFVNIRESTAMMSKKRGASLIEYTAAFCAMNGVRVITDAPDDERRHDVVNVGSNRPWPQQEQR